MMNGNGAADVMRGIGYLKLDLLLRGVRLDRAAAEKFIASGASCSDYSQAGDLAMELPGGLRVSAPALIEPAVPGSAFEMRTPYILEDDGGRTFLKIPAGEAAHEFFENGQVEVRVLHAPRFSSMLSHAGVPFSSFGTLFGNVLLLAVDRTCAIVGTGKECRFCSANRGDGVPGRNPSVEDAVDAVRCALDECEVEMVYFSLGLFDSEDRGAKVIEPFVRAVKRNFDVLIGADLCPPARGSWIERIYAMGVDSIGFNIHLFDPGTFASMLPGIASRIGREAYFEALKRAVSVFPRGAVTSSLMVGLEPIETTLQAVDRLIGMGVVPLLPLFRPQKGRDIREDAKSSSGELPDISSLAGLYSHLHRSLKRRRLPLRWARSISVSTTPAEAGFFTGESAKFLTFVDNVRRTTAGRVIEARAGDLRRLLRVREVRESFDSSEL